MKQYTQDLRDPAYRAAWIFFLCVMAAYACVVLLASKNPPPFVDLPDWVYQGVLFHGVLAGHPVAGYALKHYPVPNSVTTLGLGILDTLLPWQWSAKVWFTLYFALATLATWTLARALGIRQGRLIVTLPAILFLNLNFWYGHISFEIGLCLVMILAAMLIRGAGQTAIALILIAIFFTHMEACAAALLLLGIWAARTGELRRLWPALPTLLLTLWYTIARFARGNADARSLPASDYPYASRAFLIYKANTFFKIFGYVNARSLDGLSKTEKIFGRDLFLLLILLSICAALLCLVGIVRASASATQPTRGSLGIFVLALLLMALVLPQVILGTADPGSRLLLMATSIGFFLLDWRGRGSAAIAALSIVFCLANLWQFAKIDHDPTLQGHARDTPIVLTTYSHVEPETRLNFYDHLQQHQMDLNIFSTGIFLTNRDDAASGAKK